MYYQYYFVLFDLFYDSLSRCCQILVFFIFQVVYCHIQCHKLILLELKGTGKPITNFICHIANTCRWSNRQEQSLWEIAAAPVTGLRLAPTSPQLPENVFLFCSFLIRLQPLDFAVIYVAPFSQHCFYFVVVSLEMNKN